MTIVNYLLYQIPVLPPCCRWFLSWPVAVGHQRESAPLLKLHRCRESDRRRTGGVVPVDPDEDN